MRLLAEQLGGRPDHYHTTKSNAPRQQLTSRDISLSFSHVISPWFDNSPTGSIACNITSDASAALFSWQV
jgi:hypothetical protein